MTASGRLDQRARERSLVRSAPVLLAAFALLLPLSAPAGSRYLSPERLQELLSSEDPPLAIDVRSESDYLIAHVPGAINIPYVEFADRIPQLLRRAPAVIAVYDELGPRARRAKEILIKNGFTEVINLEGGFANWKRRGFPTEQ